MSQVIPKVEDVFLVYVSSLLPHKTWPVSGGRRGYTREMSFSGSWSASEDRNTFCAHLHMHTPPHIQQPKNRQDVELVRVFLRVAPWEEMSSESFLEIWRDID